jgi:prevent-host-death family protein
VYSILVTVRVGVREFRSKLSHYLARAKDGERIVITEHGEPVAELSKPSHYEQLVAAGKIIPARRPKRKLRIEDIPVIEGPSLTDAVIRDK